MFVVVGKSEQNPRVDVKIHVKLRGEECDDSIYGVSV